MNLSFVFCDHSDGGRVQDGSQLTPDVLSAISSAVLKQLNGEFSREWGGTFSGRIGAHDGSDVVAGEIEVAIFQNEDVSGAAGYHDRDPKGRAYIHVALDDAQTLTSGTYSLSVIISHECCETAADPGANRWADRDGSAEEALETCDRVEDTTYETDGVSVSNFLHQSAFDPGSDPPWDEMNVLSSEDGQTPGGYAIERLQGTETTPQADGSINVRFTRHMHTSRHVVRGPEDEARYKRRKNHPASRTTRRGAEMV